ncbi:putative acyl-coenzyme A synthetase like protein [Verticillium longisporum]|nr:putative acyl-coenzyme A synthetase like protein [Verticillium longisporum]
MADLLLPETMHAGERDASRRLDGPIHSEKHIRVICELIKVNALQVAPAELEAVLLENEHIADAAAVGITVNGEEKPRAYVAIQEDSKGRVTPADVAEWIKTRVAKHKRLTGGVVFVEEVPKLASGKIQRKTMREWAKRDATAIAAASQRERARL